jgi:hypothetical protein
LNIPFACTQGSPPVPSPQLIDLPNFDRQGPRFVTVCHSGWHQAFLPTFPIRVFFTVALGDDRPEHFGSIN